MKHNLTIRTKSMPEVLFAIVISVFFGLRFGLNYGVQTHNTYLLHGLRLFDPHLFVNDWITSQTASYHPFFAYVAYGLFSLTPSGWAFAIANVLSNAIGAFIIYKIIVELLEPRYVLSTYLLLMGIMSATKTYSIGCSCMFWDIFQPSTLGALGMLGGLLYFLKEKYFFSGLFLAAGGLFHANYLVLAFPVFVVAHLLVSRNRLPIRLFQQFVMLIIPLIFLLPLILETALSGDTAVAQMIFLKIRSPHHYDPLYFKKEFIPFVSWLLLALPIGWEQFPYNYRKKRHLIAVFISLLMLIAIATLLTTVVFIPKISQLYVWRLAPYAMFFSQMTVCAGMIKLMSEPAIQTRLSKAATLPMLIGIIALSLFCHYYHIHLWYLAVFLAATIFLFIWRKMDWVHKFSKSRVLGIVSLFSLLIWFMCAVVPLKNNIESSNLIKKLQNNEWELYEWAETTPKDSVFLIPPLLSNFRLNSKRAVVVDWKYTPLVPDQLIEWYHRIQIVSGIENVSNARAAEQGYANLDEGRLQEIRKEYPFDYVVFRNALNFDFTEGYELVFVNRGFIVLQ